MLYFYATFNIKHLFNYVINQDFVKVRLELRPYVLEVKFAKTF